jgi:hypothetical protein
MRGTLSGVCERPSILKFAVAVKNASFASVESVKPHLEAFREVRRSSDRLSLPFRELNFSANRARYGKYGSRSSRDAGRTATRPPPPPPPLVALAAIPPQPPHRGNGRVPGIHGPTPCRDAVRRRAEFGRPYRPGPRRLLRLFPGDGPTAAGRLRSETVLRRRPSAVGRRFGRVLRLSVIRLSVYRPFPG